MKPLIELKIGSGAAAALGGLPRALARADSKAILRRKFSLGLAKFLLATASVAVAATEAVGESGPAISKPPAILTDVSAAAPTTRPGDVAYRACQQVLQSIIDAYDNQDAPGAEAQIYFGPDADPQLVRLAPALNNFDIAAYRVRMDTAAKFAAHATALTYYNNSTVATFEELLGRLGPKDFRFRGKIRWSSTRRPRFFPIPARGPRRRCIS